jgi:hypothetical protein
MAGRPTFLSIICILLAIYGVLLIIGGAAILALGDTVKDALADASLEEFAGLFTAIGAIALIIGLLVLVVVYLLWSGIGIGWYLALIFLVINAILGILAFPIGLVTLVITVLLIWYFLRPNVRAFFGT